MECPHCGDPLLIPPRAYRNVETYQKSVAVTTECCGRMIRLCGKVVFSAMKEQDSRTQDDWGIKTKSK